MRLEFFCDFSLLSLSPRALLLFRLSLQLSNSHRPPPSHLFFSSYLVQCIWHCCSIVLDYRPALCDCLARANLGWLWVLGRIRDIDNYPIVQCRTRAPRPQCRQTSVTSAPFLSYHRPDIKCKCFCLFLLLLAILPGVFVCTYGYGVLH